MKQKHVYNYNLIMLLIKRPGTNFNYPRATRCGGDIVTLLWFRASVRAWFRPSVGRPCEHDRD